MGQAAATSKPAGKRVVRVPLRKARGPGGSLEPRLYETVVDGEPYVVWELGDGELRATPARCPHRPRRPVLHRRGVLVGGTLVCTVHGHAYCARSGECVAGPDAPGRLMIVCGRREGDTAVLTLPGEGEPC